MYDAIVLGSGVVGINTAYWLANAGLKTLVVDRQPQAGNETSYANGGQISVSFAEPWAHPATIRKALGWMLQKNAPLLITPQWDAKQWRWLFAFVLQSMPWLYKHNVSQLVQLGLYSRRLLKRLQRQHALEYEPLEQGILQFYRDHKSFDQAKHSTALMRQLGCERKIISAQQAISLEPCLQNVSQLVGGAYTQYDGSGDAHAFCLSMTQVCKQLGVDFIFDANIKALHQEQRCVHIELEHDGQSDIITAPNIAMCCGWQSAQLLDSLGIHINLYPVKGYSVTLDMQQPHLANNVSLTDDKNKVVYSRLGNQLRIAGTAEIGSQDLTIDERRCEHMIKLAKQLLPEVGGYSSSQYWCGLRPMTPSNVPIISHTQYPNLWINTGHGSLGWTLGCGSGRVLADLITHKKTPFPSEVLTGFQYA